MGVYPRGAKGVYYIDFVHRGVRTKKSTGTTVREEALLMYDQMRQALRSKDKEFMEGYRDRELARRTRHPHAWPHRMTLRDGIERCYREQWKYTKCAKNTYNRAHLMAQRIGEDTRLVDIDKFKIADMVRKLRTEGTAPATINRYLATLKTILRLAHSDWDIIEKVPRIKMQRERSGRIRVITKAEEDHIVELLQGSTRPRAADVADLIRVLVDTGMRLGEALALQRKDLDFDNRYIHVWKSKSDGPRSIPMTARAQKILFDRTRDRDQPFPFPQTSVHNIWNWLREQMGAKGDRELVLHALRHTCATRMVQAGVDLYTVKEVLGHSSIRVTERYAHLSPNRLRAAIDALEPERLSEPGNGDE